MKIAETTLHKWFTKWR